MLGGEPLIGREPLPEERLLLEFLLAPSCAGSEELREQLRHVRVRGLSCTCGCPSIALDVDRTAAPAAAVTERVSADAFGRDPDGNKVGLLLFVDDGYMVELECYSVDGVPDAYRMPTIDSLKIAEWSEEDASGTRWLQNPP